MTDTDRLEEILDRLESLEVRLIRVESRLVQLMNHMGVKPIGVKPDHLHEDN